MNHYTFSCNGFDDQQSKSIAAIVDLADSALSASWAPLKHPDADVAFINLDTEEASQIRSAIQLQLPPYRIILVSENDAGDSGECWFLQKKAAAPPSLRELVSLLNQVASCLTEAENTASSRAEQTESATPPGGIPVASAANPSDALADSTPLLPEYALAPTAPEETLSAKKYFFGLLQQAVKDNAYRIITLNKLPAMYLLPVENQFYFSGSVEGLRQLCTTDRQLIKEKIVSKAKLFRTLKSDAKAKPRPLKAEMV